MKLSEFKQRLQQIDELTFIAPDNKKVPRHFHITEVGSHIKNSIDCGGKSFSEETIQMQIWYAMDVQHRLHPDKLLKIIEKAEQTLDLKDLPIIVEYQNSTIGLYDLEYKNNSFLLKNRSTECRALEDCGIPSSTLQFVSQKVGQCCSPESNCC